MIEVYEALTAAIARRARVALVTIVRASGSTPQRVGSKMLVAEDGRTVGSIGGGCYENDALIRARAALLDGAPQLVRYDLNDDFAEESGLICGGQMDVFIEPVVPPPDLYIIGAGHVGRQLGRLASVLGFRTHIVDDREKFANRERFPDAAEIVVEDIGTWVEGATLPPQAYVVVVTRGHRHDYEALRAVAGRELKYVGLIGSRAKIARLFARLREEGTPARCLERVHAPVGLDIGAITPEEIALSIAAELVAVKYGRLDAGGRAAVRSLRWTPPEIAAADPAPADA